MAVSSGTSSVFGNPAGTGDARFAQGEIGISHWNGEDLPTAWGGILLPVGEHNFFSLGWWETNLQEFNERQAVFAASGLPFANARWGLRGVLQKNQKDLYMDVDFGLHLRFARTWQGAFTAKGLTDGLDSGQFWSGGRWFGAGIAYQPLGREREALWYDMQRESLAPWKKAVHRMGLRLAIGPKEELRLATGLGRWPGGLVQANAGISVRQPLFGSLISLGYALEGIPVSRAGELRHAVVIAMVWNAFVDRKSPRPFLRVEPVVFSPAYGVQKLGREVHFMVRVEEETKLLRDWFLAIYATDNSLQSRSIIRVFRGDGFPPRAIRWGGEDGGGTLVAPGIYAVQLVVRDASGNEARTSFQHLEIR